MGAFFRYFVDHATARNHGAANIVQTGPRTEIQIYVFPVIGRGQMPMNISPWSTSAELILFGGKMKLRITRNSERKYGVLQKLFPNTLSGCYEAARQKEQLVPRNR
jgi:hypothetical protein